MPVHGSTALIADSRSLSGPVPARAGRDRRAALAAVLSFLFPGLGQAYNGEARLAWVFAGPMLLLTAFTVALMLLASSGILARVVDTEFLAGLIVLDLALLAWRLVAIIQAHARQASFSVRAWPTWTTVAVIAVTLMMHVLPAFYAVKAIDTLGSIAGRGNGSGNGGIGAFPGWTALPIPSDGPDVSLGERVTVLLVGIDSSPLRSQALTDTMLVVSIDPNGGQSAMVSVPRDLYGVPLPDGRVYNAKLNSLMTYAGQRPAEFPLGGAGTLKAAIGDMLGIKIHYFAAVNLFGFKQAVDAIGGVDITVERAINDPTYRDELGNKTGFYLQAGPYHMNGHVALAYVRSRKGVGDNDFTRAGRQQELLTALRQKLTAGNLMLALPGLLDAVKNTIATDVPSSQFSALAQAIQDSDVSHLRRIVLQPPTHMTADPNSSAGYILVPNFDAIRQVGADVLANTNASSSPQAP
jgi:LCP family protein required for cell wall assembly